jgi:hypothetical protein
MQKTPSRVLYTEENATSNINDLIIEEHKEHEDSNESGSENMDEFYDEDEDDQEKIF